MKIKKVKSKYEEIKALHDKQIEKFWDRYDELAFKVYAGKPKKKK